MAPSPSASNPTMSLLESIQARIRRLFPKKRKRKTESSSNYLAFLEHSRVVSLLVFVLAVAAIVLTSFVGIKPSGFQILPGQVSSIRIVAADSFAYQSKILTDRKREQLLKEVPPVYRIDMKPYERFREDVEWLLTEMRAYHQIEEDLSAGAAERRIARIAEAFNDRGDYRLSSSDLATILQHADFESQRDLLETGLISLRESYKLGIYDKDDPSFSFAEDTVALFHIATQEGSIGQKRVESIEDALTSLQIVLNAENVPPDVSASVIRLFRDGLQPNLVKNEEEMERMRRKMLETLEPVIVRVQQGASIIEPGSRVTPEQREQLVAYQRHMGGKSAAAVDMQLVGRMLLALAMLTAATFYISLEDRATLQSNGRLGLLALLVVGNLALVRFCFELGNLELFLYDTTLSAILPYIAPTTLAPIIVAILIGTGPGLLTALLVSLFTAVMFGNRLDLLVMAFLGASVAIYVCRDIRRRGRVVTAGLWSGLSIAAFTALFNAVDQLPWQTIINQSLAGLLTGLAVGVVVVGILPILETLFKRTTDITLLELSDYNHPLLRRMQLEAPGSWHHSIMVANLSENAANAIGANGLLARVSCLFHDIGKLVKPEYFTENQREGVNPHDAKSPSFSALVIKSHVKEGVDLGLTYKLPRPIIDVIRQHHGTNLIRYFFHKAKEQAEDPSAIQESTYRYDGPRPRFKESGIILLADSIEAASRSLKKINTQTIEELVDYIIDLNVEDGQLDLCPLTLAELAKIRRSFIFTLLNSLHSRVAYPGGKPPAHAPAEKKPDEPRKRPVEAGAS